MKKSKKHNKKGCQHSPKRLYSWIAGDGTLVVCCCECGKVLQGGAAE